MCRVFKFCQHPELLSCNTSVYKVGNIAVNLIVCHCSDYNIIRMRYSTAASHDEIQPFLSHGSKFFYIQSCIQTDAIYRNNLCIISSRPADRLFLDNRTVKSRTKIFRVPTDSNLRSLDRHISAMINRHFCHM